MIFTIKIWFKTKKIGTIDRGGFSFYTYGHILSVSNYTFLTVPNWVVL